MPLPDRQTIKLALLNHLKDGQVHRSGEIEDKLVSHFGLTAEDLAEITKAGRTKFGNEIDWTKVELGQEGLLVKTANKHYQITQKGLAKLGLDHSQPTIASLGNIEGLTTSEMTSKRRPSYTKHFVRTSSCWKPV